MKKYRIKEIFGPTIQGEGSHAGMPCLFVRFAGCNRWSGVESKKPLSICSFCDTDFVGGERMTAVEIVSKLTSLSQQIRSVVLTGGEPTIQIDDEILQELKKYGFQIHIETNGSNNISALSVYIDHVTMSPKQTPEETNLLWCHDLKVLYPYIHEGISIEGFKDFKSVNKFLQPVWPTSPKRLTDTFDELYKNPDWKLSIQQHKILGLP